VRGGFLLVVRRGFVDCLCVNVGSSFVEYAHHHIAVGGSEAGDIVAGVFVRSAFGGVAGVALTGTTRAASDGWYD